MRLSETQKNIGIICGISGAVQGLTWTILSLIAIIVHYSPPTLSTSPTFAEELNTALYERFILVYRNATDLEMVVRPKDFVVFMFFYLFLSALWFAVSTGQLIVLISIKKWESRLMTANGLLMLGISILDIIFWGLLVRDYVDCDQFASGQDIWCYVSTGIIMTLAIRGYALWFINIIFSYLLIWYGVKNARSVKHWTDRNIGSIPRAKLQNDYRNPEPIYSDDPTMGDRRGRSSSPIFSDSPHRPPSVDRMRQPQNPSHLNRAFDREQRPEQLSTFSTADPRHFQDRGRNSRAPSSQPIQQPYEPNRQPSFLNRGYERDQGPAQPRSLGDRGGRFVY